MTDSTQRTNRLAAESSPYLLLHAHNPVDWYPWGPYMLATQVLHGQGGWPNSVFLTPDLLPFFAGTYFPPIDSRGMPGFPTVLRSMIHAWKERRGDVEQQGAELGEAIRRHLAEIEPATGELARCHAAALLEQQDQGHEASTTHG